MNALAREDVDAHFLFYSQEGVIKGKKKNDWDPAS